MFLLADTQHSSRNSMKTLFTSAGMNVLAVSTALALAASAHAATIGPQLQDQLQTTSGSLEVIVTFDQAQPLDATDYAVLQDIGLTGVGMRTLPMAGVVATPAQIDALAGHPEVRSVYFNAPLQWDNQESTQLTGVDRMRTDSDLRINGLPVSGKGIGVVVNDSGIDGLHPDLQFPEHVVQNVAAQTNLHALDEMLPITYTEDVPNTDIGGGHGTHVAGIVGGTGAASGGAQEGVAPGADIIGYGSGAGLFILDTLGGFDYALTQQFRYNIRVISNSFGSPSDTGTDFDPENPTNIATKMLSDRGVIVVFSAGNSGSGEDTITGNFKKAPWVVTVAAGDKGGLLVDFSSRGERNGGGEVTVDGETFIWQDRPTITAPGVDTLSAFASTSGGSTPDTNNPFYTSKSGTSMAAPHTSGVVALMLEANPNMDWRDVKMILQDTATNMPGRDDWEAGAGYINAYAAVEASMALKEFGQTVKQNRDFNATAEISVAGSEEYAIDFLPVGPTETVEFEVEEGIALVAASANVGENTVALVLTDPLGNRYGSSISLPVLGQNIAATAAGVPGTWELTVRGIGSVSGVALDPLGVTNGTALPGTVNATVKQLQVDGFTGINDADGHPAEGFIKFGVQERLLDSNNKRNFRPDAPLKRGVLADWLTLATGIRQAPANPEPAFSDAGDEPLRSYAEAVSVNGAALKDTDHTQLGVMMSTAGKFDPKARVNREALAFSLIQALGLEEAALAFDGTPSADFQGQSIALEDADQISPALRGHVQLAMTLGILNAQFAIEQGPFDLQPTVTASFSPQATVSRGGYAAAAARFLNAYTAASDE